MYWGLLGWGGFCQTYMWASRVVVVARLDVYAGDEAIVQPGGEWVFLGVEDPLPVVP